MFLYKSKYARLLRGAGAPDSISAVYSENTTISGKITNTSKIAPSSANPVEFNYTVTKLNAKKDNVKNK